MQIYRVFVKERALQEDMYYKNQKVMSYTIKYPHFISDRYQELMNKLNSFYKTKALMYQRSNITNLYQMAMVEFEYAAANNFPFRQFEAYTNYEITYNENCTLSLYFDQYEYAGGAHGLTLRYSDTWDLQKSKRIDLNELFPKGFRYQDSVINGIEQQIALRLETEEGMFFENYAQLIQEKFKLNNYYLTTEGVVIYYQQYDIAPYASGIPTFTLSYSKSGPLEPECK